MTDSGFFKLSRSLQDDPIWRSYSASYRSIFMVILMKAMWKEEKYNDFGKETILKPGQVILTERELIDFAFPPTSNQKIRDKHKSCVSRALDRFTKDGYSYHETNQRKTLHTITKDYLLKGFEPAKEPRTNQERTIKEEPKNKKNQPTIPSIKKVKSPEKVVSLVGGGELEIKEILEVAKTLEIPSSSFDETLLKTLLQEGITIKTIKQTLSWYKKRMLAQDLQGVRNHKGLIRDEARKKHKINLDKEEINDANRTA